MGGGKIYKTINKMAIETYTLKITLNVNRLMLQPKDMDWLNGCKKRICIYAACKRLTLDFTYRLKMKGWKKLSHANGNRKKARVAILTEDKIDFKIKTVTRD